MRIYDLSPLTRSTIGFDRLLNLAETAQRAAEDTYPPYNIERLSEDRYQISLAVAGFSPGEISITAEQNVVTIEGTKAEQAKREYLYRGISTCQFKRQFNLADYVQVKGATFDTGVLQIELVREIPEATMRPTTAYDNILNLNRLLQPRKAFDHLVADSSLSIGEKRAILASWGFRCIGIQILPRFAMGSSAGAPGPTES
jgi:molecular chaperone IbpA